MRLNCDNGRMPWPCRIAWGIAIIACVAAAALVLAGIDGATRDGSIAHPTPATETSHAQP